MFKTLRIPNHRLDPRRIPDRNADWDEISRFAHTFDGYGHWGSTERCGEVANARRQGTLTELRTCLFYEQRRWRHFGTDPDDDTMEYIRGLMDQVRQRVTLAAMLLA